MIGVGRRRDFSSFWWRKNNRVNDCRCSDSAGSRHGGRFEKVFGKCLVAHSDSFRFQVVTCNNAGLGIVENSLCQNGREYAGVDERPMAAKNFKMRDRNDVPLRPDSASKRKSQVVAHGGGSFRSGIQRKPKIQWFARSKIQS